jgi:signal transduction histidine kinase
VLRADPEQLHRVLSNLVRNARQAIAATGKAGEIRIVGSERDGGWRIEVSDTGPGLPKKALDHLFKPFHGGARKGGSGLGLAIAAEIVRGHGGTLELVQTGPAARPSPSAFPRVWQPERQRRGRPDPLRPLAADAKPRPHAPVAQLDRVLDYESRGRGFESSPVRHFLHLRYRPSGCLSESLLRYRPSGRLSVG